LYQGLSQSKACTEIEMTATGSVETGSEADHTLMMDKA
jgi:hypothetical protein